MKKFITQIAMVIIIVLITSTSIGKVVVAEKNWVQWYEGNGVYSVVGLVMVGDITEFEACEKIIIPSYEAGVASNNDINIFLEYYPEMKGTLEMNGVPVDPTPNADPTPAPTPTTPSYTIEDCDMYKYVTTDVNVRVEPDTNAGRVGSVEQNGYAHITGITSNGWYRLEYNGITGFSVQKYFADKPIEVIEEVTDVPEPTPEPTAEPTPELTEAPVATEEPMATEEPAVTEAPVAEPTEAPTPEPTEVPVATEEPTATEAPTAAPVLEATNASVEASEGSKLPFVIGGVAGVALLAIIGVCVVRRNSKRKK